MNLYCTNCGKTNHCYRDCTYPIISYGIIVFDISNELEMLMVQRKDSLTFVEFLRGKYDLDNDIKLINLLKNMSKKEKELIVKNDFDILWNNLWGEHLVNKNQKKNNHKRFQKEYYISKKKFDSIKFKLNDIIKNIPNLYDDTEWGIPKGRRNEYENDLDCAKREFFEETDLKEDDIKIFNCNPIKERFLGSNGNRYEHVYYIGLFESNKKNVNININNYNQITEIKDIGWFNKKNCLENLRPYEIERYKIIEYAFNLIENILI